VPGRFLTPLGADETTTKEDPARPTDPGLGDRDED